MFTSPRNVTCQLFCPTEATTGIPTRQCATIHSLSSKNLRPLTLHTSKLFSPNASTFHQVVKPTKLQLPSWAPKHSPVQQLQAELLPRDVGNQHFVLNLSFPYLWGFGIWFGYSYEKVFSLSTNGSHFRSLIRTVPNDPSRLWKAMMNSYEFVWICYSSYPIVMVTTLTMFNMFVNLNTSPHQFDMQSPKSTKKNSEFFALRFFSSCPLAPHKMEDLPIIFPVLRWTPREIVSCLANW